MNCRRGCGLAGTFKAFQVVAARNLCNKGLKNTRMYSHKTLTRIASHGYNYHIKRMQRVDSVIGHRKNSWNTRSISRSRNLSGCIEAMAMQESGEVRTRPLLAVPGTELPERWPTTWCLIVKNPVFPRSHGPRWRHASKAFFTYFTHHTQPHLFATSLNVSRLKSQTESDRLSTNNNVRFACAARPKTKKETNVPIFLQQPVQLLERIGHRHPSRF